MRFVCPLLAVMFLAGAMLSIPGLASAGPTEPLSSLKAGNTVSFAGYTWIVLDNGATDHSSYLLMQDALKDSSGNYVNMAFDTSPVPSFDNSGSIAGYLNSTFLNSLPQADQSLIQIHAWSTGAIGMGVTDNGASSVVQDRIGLISYADLSTTYSKYISDLPNANGWWTLSPLAGSPGGVWFVGPGLALDYVDANDTFAGIPFAIRPALYLSSATMVSGGNGGTVTGQS
jgi:hypothetical protein